MRPTDPRLLHRVPRAALVGLAGLSAVRAGAVVAQAFLLARLIARGFAGTPMGSTVGLLVVAVVVRAGGAALTELVARRASVAVREQARRDVLAVSVRRGPTWLATPDGRSTVTLMDRGIDALDGYVAGYLPQLLLAAVVPPAVLLGVGFTDLWSLGVLVLCLPLLPLFLALVGMHTRQQTEAEYQGLARMADHFLDVVVGLPTLRSFGRAERQVQVLADLAAGHRRRTLVVLRTAFLSSLVLELLASLSVALVAVSLGFRLLHGEIAFEAALTVLLLAPEAFLPVRSLGASFHSAAAALAAADALDRVLIPGPVDDDGLAKAPRSGDLLLEHVTVQHPGRPEPALTDLTLRVVEGETLVVTGESGAGKSTLVEVLLGMQHPTSGRVLVGGVDLRTMDLDSWRQQVSWVPQRPHLLAASLEDNLRLARRDATAEQLWAAVRAAYVDEFLDDLPNGLATHLGERGSVLSAGQAKRVALARAFLRDARVVVLDEPTADLDVASELAVAAALEALCAGRTAVITTHRAAAFHGWARCVALPSRRPVAA